MDTTAMQAEKAMHGSDRERPRSRMEKFLQAWNEKLKHQHSAISSPRELECQSAIGNPTQENVTRDQSCSQMPRGATMQPSETAFYVLRVNTPPLEQQYSNPGSIPAPRDQPQNLPTPQVATSSLDQENKGELIHICVTDLLLASPGRKRPRLLPPNSKMHVEVWKKDVIRSLQESERSPVPVEYIHLVDTMEVTKPEDLPKIESFYRRFSPRRRQWGARKRLRQFHTMGERPSPASGREAVTNQPRGVKRSHEQHLLDNPDPNVPFSSLTGATEESVNISQNGHLPPKKRYTQSCL